MAQRSPITTHILDTSAGRPAAGVEVVLEQDTGSGDWQVIGRGTTDADGRVGNLLEPGPLSAGPYRITFATADYLTASGHEVFYPEVQVTFAIRQSDQHYHIPLLLSPYGYSTYRGS